jgi:hypothetical protein
MTKKMYHATIFVAPEILDTLIPGDEVKLVFEGSRTLRYGLSLELVKVDNTTPPTDTK